MIYKLYTIILFCNDYQNNWKRNVGLNYLILIEVRITWRKLVDFFKERKNLNRILIGSDRLLGTFVYSYGLKCFPSIPEYVNGLVVEIFIFYWIFNYVFLSVRDSLTGIILLHRNIKCLLHQELLHRQTRPRPLLQPQRKDVKRSNHWR